MSQQEPSKRNKKAKNKTFAKPGSLSFLANKKRRLLTTNEIVQSIECEKGHLLKLLEVQQPLAPQSEANRQSVEVQPVEEQPSVDQVQMNSVTPQTNNQPKEQAEDVSTQNKRGRTQMHNVHARKERKLILLNRENQHVGPTDDVVTELSSFLGTLARNATICPFDILDWRSMDTKQDLWDYTKEKYIIPEAAYNWTMVTIREAWRRHRSDLKMTYYDPYDNDEVRMENRPGHIPECQFRELLKYWKSEKFKAEMEEIEKQMSTNDQYVDAFSTVMDPEHPGHLRLYGVGVTKTTLKKKVGNSESTLNATTDGMQQMQERMQKVVKQMEEQKKTVRQEVIADVIAQLKHAGLIDPNILAALSIPSPSEPTSVQGAEQGDEIEEGDESSSEDLT